MKLLYSVRDNLGRELWWTTSRKAALALAHDFNLAGVGATLYRRATGRVYAARMACYGADTAENDAARSLSAHHLPVSVWKCNVQKKKPVDNLDGGAPHVDCDCMACRPWTT